MTPLRQRMIDDMSVRGLSENTRKSYLSAMTGLTRHYRRSPDHIEAREIQDYLLFLHEKRGLTWKSCNTIRHGHALLLSHHHGAARPPLVRARCQAAFQAARNPQPRRTGAPVHRHHQPQAPSPAHDGLCRRAASQRTRSSPGFRHRFRTHGSACRTGQGQQGSLRAALAPASGATARLLAPQAARTLVVPGPTRRPAHEPPRSRAHLQPSPRKRPASTRRAASIRCATAMPPACSRPASN